MEKIDAIPAAKQSSPSAGIPLGWKLAWVAVLYLAQGLPFGIVNNAMPVAFSKAGVDLKDIGLLALAGLPWTFKFLWAPLIDRIGGRRRWVAGCLAGMAALTTLFGASFAGEATPFIWALILGIAILSATQDIAIDAYSIELLEKRELGHGNGVRVTAYRVALILAGGAVVAFAGTSGWKNAWWLAAGILLALGLLAPLAPSVERRTSIDTRSLGEVLSDLGWAIGVPFFGAVLVYYAGGQLGWTDKWRIPLAVVVGLVASTFLAFRAGNRALTEHGAESPLGTLLARKGAWGLLTFALLFKLGDQAMAPMTTPFLDRGAGFSTAEIGILRNTVGMLAAIAGALLGGWFTSRIGIFHALWILGLFQAISNLGYAVVVHAPGPPVDLRPHIPGGLLEILADLRPWIGLDLAAALQMSARNVWGAAFLEDFCGGLGTAPFLALLMSACDRRHAATQYAFLSAVYGLCRTIAGTISGYLAEELGFGSYFALTFALALPAFALLPLIRPVLDRGQEDDAAS